MKKKILRIFGKTVKWFFIVFCIYVASFFFREGHLPAFLVRRMCDLLSGGSVVVKCDEVLVGFRRGIYGTGIRVYDRSRQAALTPVLSVDSISLFPLTRRLRAVGVKFPRLGDGYYGIKGAAPASAGPSADLSFVRRLPAFDVELLDCAILGVCAERLTMRLTADRRAIGFDDIRIDWPNERVPSSLNGWCRVDLEEKRVSGRVEGLARQVNIRPLMVALDLPIALPYFDAFTGVENPVPSACAWGVNLETCAFTLDIDLHPTLGRYNGVPLRGVDGGISIAVDFPEGRSKRYVTTVGPLVAKDRSGGALEGRVTFSGGGGESDVISFDAQSTLAKEDALDVIGYLNDGLLDGVRCDDPPSVTVRGRLYPDAGNRRLNDLGGHLALGRGALFGMTVASADCDYTYIADHVGFTNAVLRGRMGGRLSGWADIRVPSPSDTNASFRMSFDCREAHLGEFATIDLGERFGNLEGALALSGPLADKLKPQLNGEGWLRVRDGHLAQMKIFLGLTEMLAEYVPGVSAIVNQSQASADFTISNGVIRTENLLVEGSLFSIRAEGSYDMPEDRLDFKVQVRFLKDENLLGKYLIRPILWPFSKLLLEFRLTGSVSEPNWTYISILDRVL